MAARIFRPKISHSRKFCFGDIFLSFGDISVSFGGISVSFGEILLFKFRKWFKYGLKAQKLLAQGSALGMMAISKTP
mgnify:CR=1 FL=1